MKAIIEMPRGDTVRRHLKFDGTGFIELGPIKDVIPVNDGIMPVHYGYLPGTRNPEEGDEIDVLVFSDGDTQVGQEMEIRPIAIIRRSDGDDKVVAVGAEKDADFGWSDVSENERSVVEAFFSHHHDIVSIDDAATAQAYIENHRT